MLISWKNNFVIDNGIIDEDHKFLITTLNSIISKLNNHCRVVEFLREVRHLRAFAEMHFRREERLQIQAGYPEIEAHRAEHARLLEQIDAVVQRLGALPPSVVVADYKEMKSFLYRWILVHIIESDVKIRPFVENIDCRDERPLSAAMV